jgi:tetratricopeptide (TPR) repeat protein
VLRIFLIALLSFAVPAALAQSNKDANAHYQKALQESRNETLMEQALRDVDKAIEISKTDARYYSLKAYLLFYLQEDDACVAAARKAIDLDPKDANAWADGAKALRRSKQLEEGLKWINTSIKLRPKAAMGYIIRSDLHASMNRLADAEQDLDRAILLEPARYDTYKNRIAVCEQLKKWPKVIADCTVLAKEGPDRHSGAFRSRASAYCALHQYDKAVSDLKSALKIWPDDFSIHKELEAVYKAKGDQKGLAEEKAQIDSLNRDYRK